MDSSVDSSVDSKSATSLSGLATTATDGTHRKLRSLQGTWGQAITQFLLSVLFLLTVRWAFFEPYVIPSGSMIPTLLIHDHILVNKFAFGLRIPFSSRYLVRWAHPKRGDVIVFRSVDQSEIFLIKRVVGLPGDTIEIGSGPVHSGQLRINGKWVPVEPFGPSEAEDLVATWPGDDRHSYLNDMDFRYESLDQVRHVILSQKRHETRVESESENHENSLDTNLSPIGEGPYTVPADHFFMMGDNRDHSSDSRVWGSLPQDSVLGKAVAIWLSCEETLRDSSRVCDPETIRWQRIFSSIQ